MTTWAVRPPAVRPPAMRPPAVRPPAVVVVMTLAVIATLGAGALGPVGVGSAPAGASSSALPAVSSSGCGSHGLSAGENRTVSFAAAGDQGSYLVEVPSSYRTDQPMPLVMDLHGYSDPANIQADITGLGAYGDSQGFITVTPQVDYQVPRWDTSLGSKDLSFLADLLTSLEQQGCIAQRRVYSTGYSDGAFMTSAVACQLSSRIAAVAPVAGIQDAPGCHPTRPVPVVAFHGTADPFVPYLGGIGPKAMDLPAPDGSGKTIGQELQTHPNERAKVALGSIPTATAGWARRNGCARAYSAAKVASDVTRIAYHCPHDASVVLYRVTGGGHTWPGSVVSAGLAPVTGRTTFSISANRIMWAFFRAHPLTD